MWREGVEQGSDAPPSGFLCAFGTFAQEVFEFGEDLLDRIEVWAVGRQEQQARAFFPDRSSDGRLLVAGEIVEDDDVAWPQCRAELFLDPLGEAGAIDRLIEHERRIDPVAAQRGNEGHRLPVPVWHLGVEPLADRCPAAQGRHVGLGPGLVDKDQAGRIRPALELLPLLAPPGHLGPQLFGGKNAFF